MNKFDRLRTWVNEEIRGKESSGVGDHIAVAILYRVLYKMNEAEAAEMCESLRKAGYGT